MCDGFGFPALILAFALGAIVGVIGIALAARR
jgi:hypothetical protein